MSLIITVEAQKRILDISGSIEEALGHRAPGVFDLMGKIMHLCLINKCIDGNEPAENDLTIYTDNQSMTDFGWVKTSGTHKIYGGLNCSSRWLREYLKDPNNLVDVLNRCGINDVHSMSDPRLKIEWTVNT